MLGANLQQKFFETFEFSLEKSGLMTLSLF